MNALFSRYATPLTTGLFLASLVSGVALFFHWQQAAFHGMHEWLSMVLVLPFALHVWKNWRAFITYFRRPPMAVALGLSLAAAIAFAWPALTSAGPARSGPPQFAVLEAVGAARLEQMATLFGHDAQSLIAGLRDRGYTVASASKTFDEIAAASGKSNRDIMGALGSLKR